MANIDLSKYGITGAVEVLHNPSYEVLFQEETKAFTNLLSCGLESLLPLLLPHLPGRRLPPGENQPPPLMGSHSAKGTDTGER